MCSSTHARDCTFPPALVAAHCHLIRTGSVITCAGGLGTLEELSEFLCQQQLKIHNKPIALLNTRGFFDALLQQLQHMVAEGFLPASHIHSLIVERDVGVLLDKVSPLPSRLRCSCCTPLVALHNVLKCVLCSASTAPSSHDVMSKSGNSIQSEMP
jgi:hypothetical protein